MLSSIIPAVISFLGFITGGIIGKIVSKVFPNKSYHLMVLCGGVLIGLILFELIPEAYTAYDHVGIYIGMLLGMSMMILLDHVFHAYSLSKRTRALQSVTFLVVAVALHNVPTGLSLGGNITLNNTELNTSLLLFIFLHLIPEGMALVIPFLWADHGIAAFIVSAIFLSLIIGVTTKIGISLDYGNTVKINAWLMGVAISSIGFVTIKEIILESGKQLKNQTMFLYVVIGIGISKLYFVFI